MKPIAIGELITVVLSRSTFHTVHTRVEYLSGEGVGTPYGTIPKASEGIIWARGWMWGADADALEAACRLALST